MPYCTFEDVLDELHQTLIGAITRMCTAAGETIQERIEKHIAKAQGYVDVVLGQAFAVPLEEPVSSVVAIATAKVAANFVGVQGTEKDDVLADKLSTADRMLKALVAAGVFPGETSETSVTPARIVSGSQAQKFTTAMFARWEPT